MRARRVRSRKARDARVLVYAALLAAALAFTHAAAAYQEAPQLTDLVAEGKLPPVEKRLPENPAIVEPVNQIGIYGGTWRKLAMGALDMQLSSRMAYEPLVRWDRTGRRVVPGLAESWEIHDEGKTYVFHLRKGLRWSDGHPFTSEDFLFRHEDIHLNKTLTPVFPSWLAIGGTPCDVMAPDPYTVVFQFTQPYGVFLEYLAFRGNFVYSPKHYLKQFHPRYTDEETLVRRAKEAGVDLWQRVFSQRTLPNENPELPVMTPWKLTVPPPASRTIAERNPYYWKVDPAGNQLPYIDRVVFTDVQSKEILNFKAMAGEVDFQARRIDSANYTLFMENRKQGGYRVLRDPGAVIVVVYINQYSRDPELRPLLQDKRFRIALSAAVNRDELIDLIYSGLAQPSRGVGTPHDPYYLPEFDEKYIDYDPALANQLLDELGMARGRNGLRRLPNGKPFRQIMNVYPSETGTGADQWQLVADYWREVGLDFVVKFDAASLSVMQVCNGNSDFWAYAASGLHWAADPLWYVPWQSSSYFAPLYGRYQSSGGKSGVKPSPEFQRLIDTYLELRASVGDKERKRQLGHAILRQWAEECYTVGICIPELLAIVSNRFKNVPNHIIHSYQVMSPGYIGVEQFYIDESDTAQPAEAGG